MKIRKRCMLFAAALALVLCASCASSETDTQKAAPYARVTADADGFITWPADQVTSDVQFLNYDANGTTVQILLLRDDAGDIRAAFNTCQSCSPSPKAYYVQEDDKLICQNCGFDFTPEEVGIVHGGCNPWPVDGIEITDTQVRIPASSADAMAQTFANWGGPTGD